MPYRLFAMRDKLFIFIAFIVFGLLCVSTEAQELISPAPHAMHIKTLDNINLAEVNKVMRSKSGYIWIATAEGLVRFDGYDAKHYQFDATINSLSHNAVMDVVEDAQQNLWISTYGGGLNKFNPHTGLFQKINLQISEAQVTDFLYFLSIDENNQLWVGSRTGLIRVDVATEKARPLPQALKSLPQNVINGAFIDNQKNLWFGTFFDGLYRYDPKGSNQKLQHFAHDETSPGSLSNNNVRTVSEDEKGNIWVGTTMGLNLYQPTQQHSSEGPFKRFRPSYQDPSLFTELQDDITAIQSGLDGNLWLGTMIGGTQLFSLQTQQFTPVTGKRDLEKQFETLRVNSITFDQDRNFWFSTSAGIVFMTHTARRFKYLSNAGKSLRVTGLTPLNSGKVALIGQYNYFEYDKSCHCVEQPFDAIGKPFRVVQTDNDDLWITSIGNGLTYYSAKTGKTEQFVYHPKSNSGVPNNNIAELLIDQRQQIWIAPFFDLPHSTGGLFRFDHNKQISQPYFDYPSVITIKQTGQNQLLLATDVKGLISLNTQTKQHKQWHDDIPSAPLMLRTLFFDNNDNIWLGTRDKGLAYYDRHQNTFTYFTVQDGLLSNSISSIVQDNDHNLWLGTSIGLTRFNPTTKQVLNFQQRDGLLFSDFYRQTALKTADGQIMMGSNNGLVMFDPADLDTQNTMPKVVINDFKMFNQSVVLSDDNGISTPLKKPIAFTDELVLTHKDDVFSFEFAALEYVRPNKIQFAYKMEGLNDNWIYTDGSNRIANYNTLSDGHYVFKVKSTNANGQWNTQEAHIKVVILPPWWLTWQAYVIYVLAALSGVICFIRVRTAKFVEQAKLLEQRVTQRTEQLQQSNQQLELSAQQLAKKSQAVSDLLDQKQRLFASISHEFRTPLTLILSPVDQLLCSSKGKPINKELTLIKRSGRRLLRMVDQLLEFAKLEQNTSTTLEQVSLAQTVSIITESFEALFSSKQITLRVLPFEDVTLNLLSDSLNKILINILSNAFKYTPDNGEIILCVNQQNDQVSIAIEDNGVGICESDRDAIFERFNRASHNHDESVSGAGIGLALVKELAEANQGQISLKSEIGKGSTFTITLPIPTSQGSIPVENQPFNSERLGLEIDSINTNITIIENPKTNQSDQQKSILIIDDNADMRQLLFDQLSGQYHCLQAQNGQVGLATAREQLPDLIISDVMMPVMDGYELAQSLKNDELTSHIPIILLTAKGSLESRIKGLQLLVDDYLAKPFNVEELTLRINNILSIRDIVRKRYGQAIDNKASPLDAQIDMGALEQQFLEKVNQQLAKHYGDVEFSAIELSEHLALSERQLQRKIKALFDVSIPEMVRNYRLNKAKVLLSDGKKASQIYFSVGFSSHSYFTSCFKAKFGKTPTEYQKVQHQKAQ